MRERQQQMVRRNTQYDKPILNVSELEKPTTEGVKNPERQSDKRERDPGDRRETAGQTEQQMIRQTDRETQITLNCEGEGGGALPPTRSGRGG